MDAKNGDIVMCYISRRNLRWTLVWPSMGEELHPRKIYYMKFLIFCVTTGIVFTSVSAQLYLSLKDHMNICLSENIAILISFFGIYFAIFAFISKRSKVAELVKHLSDFKNFGQPPNLQKENRFLTLVANGIFVYSLLGPGTYMVVKYFNRPSECETFNNEESLIGICRFGLPVRIPFDIQRPLLYYIVLVYTFVFAQLLTKPPLFVLSLVFEIIGHIIIRIKHLNKMIRCCFEENEYSIGRKRLVRCIQYHNNILNLTAELDLCFSNAMFTHLVLTSSVCACLEKQFIEGDKLCAAVHMLGWVLALLLSCIAGQMLLNAGDSISETIWISQWYTAHPKLRRDIQFFLIRSQRNLYLSAGSFGIVSYSLFLSVMKMSYSILCLLTS